MNFKRILEEHGATVATLGGFLIILNQLGFSTDIPAAYHNLTVEGKILFIGTLNFIFTLILFFYTLEKRSKKNK